MTPMRKLLVLGLPLVIAACSTTGVPNGDVTGDITGAPTNQGTIRLALLGLTFGGTVNESVEQFAVTPTDRGVYALTLPATPRDGGYEVIAYADRNGNGTYDPGETRTQSSGKILAYTTSNFVGNVTGLSKGWNLVQDGRLVKSGTPFNNYDLSF